MAALRRRRWPAVATAAALAVAAAQLRCCLGEYARVDAEKVRELLSKMTLREKYEELCLPVCPDGELRKGVCDPTWVTGPEAAFDMQDNLRLKIRGFRTRDGPRGITCKLGGTLKFWSPCPADGSSPAFPAQSLRAATWSVELEEEVGRAVGEIGQALDLHIVFLPSINILPWLNWGRAQESYGEDPFLNGKMGAGIVRGVQSQGVMATAKHFLANNIENTRWYVSAEFDDKILHEVYLRAWARIVAESSPEMVMTSYNRVQGKWANQNPKFIKILRERLGYEGSVMTDWWATFESIMAAQQKSPFHGMDFGFMGNDTTVLTAGVDLEMPFCNFDKRAAKGLASCDLGGDAGACQAANVIDRAVGHLLRSKLRYGLVGDQARPKTKIDPPLKYFTQRAPRGLPDSNAAVFDDLRYSALALKVAQQGIVLLKNEASFLPKRPQGVKSVVVMGTPEKLELGDRGSSFVTPSGPTVTVMGGLRLEYGAAKVTLVEEMSDDTLAVVRGADLIVLDVGFNYTHEGEFIPPGSGGDRPFLGLLPADVKLIREVAKVNSKVVVAITAGTAVTVEDFIDDVQAVLWMGYPGPLGGHALAQILTGQVNPSGRMTSATPRAAKDFVPAGITLEPWKGDAEVQYPYSHGFKHMWGAGILPRFPLGWGLSFTTFTHGAPSLRGAEESSLPTPVVRVEVTNTGKVAGIETVQVYATCPACKRKRLPILLVGFARTSFLAPEASEELVISFSAKDLAVYDMEKELWVLEKGTYQILAGPCADSEKLKSVDFTVPEDVTFDYPGASSPPDVVGVGDRACSAYKCQRDEDFLRIQQAAEDAAFRNWLIIVTSLLVLIVSICFFFWCCCLRSCFRRCCGKSAMPPKTKEE